MPSEQELLCSSEPFSAPCNSHGVVEARPWDHRRDYARGAAAAVGGARFRYVVTWPSPPRPCSKPLSYTGIGKFSFWTECRGADLGRDLDGSTVPAADHRADHFT